MPVVLRGLLVLGERYSAGGFDLAEAERAVGASPRQDHADRMRPLHRGQRSQKVIDRIVRSPIVGTRRHRQQAVRDRDVGVRLNHVDVIGLDLGAVDRVHDRHRRVWREQFRESTLVLRDRDVERPRSRGPVSAGALRASGSAHSAHPQMRRRRPRDSPARRGRPSAEYRGSPARADAASSRITVVSVSRPNTDDG